jgi:DNA-binding SARP family transcriptional activator
LGRTLPGRPTEALPSGYRPAVISFGILGPLEARRDGAEVALGGRIQRAVLALLLLEAGRVVSIDRIADELYAGDAPATAMTQVHRQISELRRALGEATIETRPPGYVVHVGPEALDLRRFEALCARADQAEPAEAVVALDEALGLWRGDALADLAGESFAQRPVARLDELRLRALERRIEVRLALGRHADVIGELTELAAAQPLRERLRALLMLALYRAGRQVEALEVYRETRVALVDAFGVEPGVELVRLEQAILRHDPELSPEADGSSDRTGAVLVAGGDLAGVQRLAGLAAPLARRPGHELIVALLLAQGAGLADATAALAAERARSPEPMRVAAFVSRDEPADVLRLARTYDAGLVLVAAPPGFAEGQPPPDALVELLARSPADVAVVAPGAGPGRTTRGVIVPFGGGEHDWAAVELAAWLATATDEPLRLAGSPEASRLLADASMAVQRLAGVVAEPVLVEPSATGMAEATADATAVVVGLSPRWRHEGLGEARRALATPDGPPLLAVHRGPRPSGVAPREATTRFTWSAGD